MDWHALPSLAALEPATQPGQTRTAFPYLTQVFEAFGLQWNLPLPVFGLFVVLAFGLGLWALKQGLRRQVRQGLLAEPMVAVAADIAVTVMLLGLVGAKLFSLLETPDLSWAALPGLLFSGAGLTIYGGLIVGGLGFAWLARKHRLPVLRVLDSAGPAYLLAYAIGRLGCQLAGDGDWGIGSDPAQKPDWLPLWLWSQQYVGNIVGAELPPPGVYPTPLYESLMALASFALLWKLPRTLRHRAGLLLGLTLVLVGAERLLIEPIRVNVPYHIAGFEFTQAQLLSVPILLFGAWLIARAPRRP